ncbi:PqqD family protein [uncultured Ruminococcus sp.]|uniref:PqqD family protein n=1 Tax=uncultured Ruminococcus sp. TaxID=165186 RepID=UPI002622AEDF|nr:PqqD family protein [uncultured Ruminococcus sp.]
MKLAVEMAVMELDDEISAVAVGEDSAKFHGMLRLNETAAEIIKMLAEDTTPEKIHKALCEKYNDSTPDEIGKLLADFLNQLNAEGLLKI